MNRPLPVKSDIGVPGPMAAGSGSPSCFARRIIDSVSAPPAEVPKIAMFFAVRHLQRRLPRRDPIVQCRRIGASGGRR